MCRWMLAISRSTGTGSPTAMNMARAGVAQQARRMQVSHRMIMPPWMDKAGRGSSFGQCRDQPPDQVGREGAGKGGVEFIHQGVEAVGIGQAVAAADVLAEQVAQALAVLGRDRRGRAAGFAEL